MTLVRLKPMREFDNKHNLIQKYFDDLATMKSSFNENAFSPKINISEKENQLIINAEIPGVKKENLKITLQDNILTIEGEKKNESEANEIKYLLSERNYGSFKRSFTLQENIDSDKVKAKFEDGVLSITLSKIEEKAPVEKVIEVK
ncbi:MAG: Hsp20/alpha crystallin family protein [Bacteroidetes bacterium]|nr:Hsp20/alpha crystallin family protein [Bacteroidota bacterium]MBU1113619.1 Hsp20/alpha crystallin family protein [Bacteroidota bacterium]MBU1797757.1 Hsp20/alpha crystallin family protein [Bacteroidota bacterium]